MEFEKLLDKRLNALKEENTKTLNEYAFLSKQQNDLNDKIGKKLEEREQAKSQLTEYETNRALKSNYDIERNQEEIMKLKQAIKENEDKQMAQLMKELQEIENEVRNSAYEIIERKGATAYGIGMCLVRITNAIIEDKNIILPVSSWDARNEICISTPAIVNKDGVKEKVYIPLNYEETQKLINSIDVIKEAISKVY